MEPKGSLPHSQVPATCPYPVPQQSSPCPLSCATAVQSMPPILCHSSPVHALRPTSWRSILILTSHLSLDLPSGFFGPSFPTEVLYAPLLSPIRATCPAHLILLYLVVSIIFGAQYSSLSFSLCSFLHSHFTSALLGPNTLLNNIFSTPSAYK